MYLKPVLMRIWKWTKEGTQTTFPISRRRNDARGQYPKLPLNHVFVVYLYSVTGTFPFNSISDTQCRYPCTMVYGPFNTIEIVMHVYIWQIILVGLHSRVYGFFIIIISPTSVLGDILFSHCIHISVHTSVCHTTVSALELRNRLRYFNKTSIFVKHD